MLEIGDPVAGILTAVSSRILASALCLVILPLAFVPITLSVHDPAKAVSLVVCEVALVDAPIRQYHDAIPIFLIRLDTPKASVARSIGIDLLWAPLAVTVFLVSLEWRQQLKCLLRHLFSQAALISTEPFYSFLRGFINLFPLKSVILLDQLSRFIASEPGLHANDGPQR